MVSCRMVSEVYQQLTSIVCVLMLSACLVTNADGDGSKVVDCILKTRDECVVLFAENCQEGFTIEHDYGFEMVGRCVR
jgi:hypothetical protein